MAFSSRPTVVSSRQMRNSSKIHCTRSLRAAHDAVDRRDRPALDDLRQRLALPVVQLRRVARRAAVDEPRRAALVEAHDPVPDDLKRHAADLCRIGARGAVIDRRQRQKPARLIGVLGRPRQPAKGRAVKIVSQGKSASSWRTSVRHRDSDSRGLGKSQTFRTDARWY